ncbi:carnitine O-acetyltransferase-like [Ornithodoros turicata]|uniref:carnitine O-acetyltransferase-like n=1 Tax=Ornithodoros turicata TaxID=34597 RepID=UPI003138C8E5
MISRLQISWACRRMVNGISRNTARSVSAPAGAVAQEPIMLSRQKDLPRLPVPPLQETLDRYLKSVKPLVSAEEYEHTVSEVEQFIKPGGTGEELYTLLQQRAQTKENWVSEWWLREAYLKYRMPVVVYSNPAMSLPRQNFATKQDQLRYAATLIAGALDFKNLVDKQLLKPDMMKDSPLDMSQYQKIFCTCRVPKEGCDELESYLLEDDPPKHIIVVHNNQFFALDVYHPDGTPYDERHILPMLEKLAKLSMDPDKPIGILTTEHRDVWSKAYSSLCSTHGNAESVAEIKKAMFVVCLDQKLRSNEPYEVTSAFQMLVGGPRGQNAGNRWCDKTVQFIVGEEGNIGLLYEHSPSEGPPVAVLVDHCNNYITNKENTTWSSEPTGAHTKKLKFVIDSQTEQYIQNATKALAQLEKDIDLRTFKFPGYGRDFIKSCKLSPDSFVQMAIQLAFYKMHEVPGATYESATTRKFLHGRTETIRSTSMESLEFCKTFHSSRSSNTAKENSLRQAVEAHKKYTNLAVNGLGVDRLLFGLKCVAAEKDITVPSLYFDLGYIISTHFRLSTSQVPTKCDALMFYGPLVQDGYGCCYNPRQSSINFGLSSFTTCFETSTAAFRDALDESLTQMHDCLVLSQKSKL